MYCPEPYLLNYLAKGVRSVYAQFRTGVLPLQIETGRYDKTPLENRICKLCRTNVIEDEYHMLCICPIYNDARTDMYNTIRQIDTYFPGNHDRITFIYLMKHHQITVAKFIFQCWNIRKLFLYT